MSRQMDALIHATETDRPHSEWEPLFAKRTSPLVFYYGHAVVRINLLRRHEVPTILKMAKLANPLDTQDSIAECIGYQLNDHMQKILLGIPGATGQPPA